MVNEKTKVKVNDVAISKIHEGLALATRYLSEAAAALAATSVPAVGFPLDVKPVPEHFGGAQPTLPVVAAAQDPPAFTDVGVRTAHLLSDATVHAAHAAPVVAAAAPLIALPADPRPGAVS